MKPEVIKIAIDAILDKAGTREPTQDNIMYFVGLTMEAVEKYSEAGEDKKEVVKEIITSIITKSSISDDAKLLSKQILDSGVVDGAIELAIDVSQGKISINDKISKLLSKLKKKLFPCCKC